MKLALLIVAAVFAAINIVRSRGQSLTSWAVLALCAYLYL